MTAAERRALLGDEAVESARAQARRAIEVAPPSEEVIARLRRILTRPALPVIPAARVAPSVPASENPAAA